jgi:hypothetical protein
MDDLWWRTIQQRAIKEVDILANDDPSLDLSETPDLRVRGSQLIEVEQMLGVMTMGP